MGSPKENYPTLFLGSQGEDAPAKLFWLLLNCLPVQTPSPAVKPTDILAFVKPFACTKLAPVASVGDIRMWSYALKTILTLNI